MREFILGDCMDKDNRLPSLPDAKDAGRRVLAIVDPPYGIGYSQQAAIKSGQHYGKAAAKNRMSKGIQGLIKFDAV